MVKPLRDPARAQVEQDFAEAVAMWRAVSTIGETPEETQMDTALAGDALMRINGILDAWNDYQRRLGQPATRTG